MLDYIYISTIAIALLAGIIFKKKPTAVWYWLLLVFLLVSFCNELITYFLKAKHQNNLPFYNAYYYFRFPLLSIIFYDAMKGNKIIKYLVTGFLVITALFFLFNLFYYKSFYVLHTNYLLAGGLATILYCLLYLYHLLKSDLDRNPLTTPFFWVSTGFLLYFLGILPSLGIINILAQKDLMIASQKLIISKSLSIVLYSLLSFSFYLQWKQTK